jgi:hypothetical protein
VLGGGTMPNRPSGVGHLKKAQEEMENTWAFALALAKAPFGLVLLKFNSHHINIPLNAWSAKYRLIVCMSTQIKSNLRDESIKPN